MFVLLTIWAIMGLVYFAAGAPLLYRLNLQTELDRAEDRIFVAIWLGIILLANLLLLASLVTPINLYVTLLIFAAQALPSASIKCRPILQGLSLRLPNYLGLFTATLLVAVLFATSLSRLVDTGAYHQQLVKWLSEYGSVPGLALIKNQFGFTSSWFALAAPLWTGALMDRLVVGLNGFVFLLMILQIVIIAGRILNGRARFSDWFFIVAFALFCRYSFTSLLYSLSPDVPAALLTMIVAWLIIVIEENRAAENEVVTNYPGIAVVFLAAGAVSIKLSTLPLLAVAIFYYVFSRRFTVHKAYIATALTLPFIAIVMGVSTVISGCPLYPAPYFCTDLPWSLGSESAKEMSKTIYEFATWVGQAPADATSINWLWHKPPNNNYFNDKPLMLGLLVTNLLCGAWLYIRRHRLEKTILLYVPVIALAGIIFTLIKAPHLRFSIGFFIVAPAFTCAFILLELSQVTWRGITYLSKQRAAFLLAGAYFAVSPMMDTFRYLFYSKAPPMVITKALLTHPEAWLLWPRETMYSRNLASAQANGFVYFYRDDPRDGTLCWNAPLPCAPSILDKSIRLRDENVGLSTGFSRSAP